MGIHYVVVFVLYLEVERCRWAPHMQNCTVIVTGLSGLGATANKIEQKKRNVNMTNFVPLPLLGTPS